MASRTDTIKYYINIINTAVRGEDVRMAIVELLKLANNSQSNANTLDGHSASYFAKQSDMDQILPLADGLIEGSTRPVGSGDLYYYLNTNVRNELNEILQEFTSGTITDKIEDLADVRYRIMTALNEKGAALTTQSTFESFADKIDQIPVSMNFQTETLNVTENDTYTAPENKAYTTVKVEVNPRLVTKTVKSLGTFKAKDEGEDVYGFSEVTVELDSGSGGGGEGDLKLVEKSIDMSNMPEPSSSERSKTFDPSDDEALGYSKVTVNTAGMFGEHTEDIDPSAAEQVTFSAADDGFYGYSKITINIREAQGPFTVEFWDGSTKIQTVSVERGQTATCTNPITPPTGKVFAGWSPNPVNVTTNMKCYAQFTEEHVPSYEQEIQKTWDEIGQNRGADLELGEFKILHFKSFTYDGIDYKGGSILMQVVSKDEPGSTTTWLSTGYLKPTTQQNPHYFRLYESSRSPLSDFKGWSDCDLRTKMLNNALLSAIRDCNDADHGYSGAIVPYIEATASKVSKTTYCFKDESESYEPIAGYQTAGDCLWIPSTYEMGHRDYRDKVETGGTVYSIKTNVTVPTGYATPDINSHVRSGYSRSDEFDGTGQRVGSRLQLNGTGSGAGAYYDNGPIILRYTSNYVAEYNAQHPSNPIKECEDPNIPIRLGFCL